MKNKKHKVKEEDKQQEMLVEKAIKDAKAEIENQEREREVLFDTLIYYLQGRDIVIGNFSS